MVEEEPPEEPAPQMPPLRSTERLHTDWELLRNEVAADYPELGGYGAERRHDVLPPIFVTARFRSGSTMLWNLLRHVPGLTTYYEPLHPFLQLAPAERPKSEDPTHVGVSEYWSEYDRIEGLASYYTEPWHNQDLYLDASHWKPRLARYLRLLIDTAPGRAVLQMNRADFRLAWLRQMFPEATVVHLYRHPRDQWLSALRDPCEFGVSGTPEEFCRTTISFWSSGYMTFRLSFRSWTGTRFRILTRCTT